MFVQKFLSRDVANKLVFHIIKKSLLLIKSRQLATNSNNVGLGYGSIAIYTEGRDCPEYFCIQFSEWISSLSCSILSDTIARSLSGRISLPAD